MRYKCYICDPIITKEMRENGVKPVKSIDTDKDDFIKDERNKYFHTECYKEYLLSKKIRENEINDKINFLKKIQEEKIKEAKEKDKFLCWIMDFYDGSLPSYFLKKLQFVREGTYKGLNEKIDYVTLLDIYQHMEKYLRKLAAKKQFNNISQRMNYDLAVVVGNYGDYKRFKEKQKMNKFDKREVEKHTSVTNKVQKLNKEKDINDNFDITDVIDELLL